MPQILWYNSNVTQNHRREKGKMVTGTEIENQKVHIDYLKSEMRVGYADLDPDRWAEQRGYIPTCEYFNRAEAGTWTEGIHYVVLDEDNIAFRAGGDFRDDSAWWISDVNDFIHAVITDAEEFLARWIEEKEDALIEESA